MNQRLSTLPYIVLLGSIAALFVVMNTTDPTESIASILLVFLLLYASFTSFFYLILGQTRRISALYLRRPHGEIARKKSVGMTDSRAYYVASALAFAPVCLLAMKTLNQVRALDLALVATLTVLVVFYVVKRTE